VLAATIIRMVMEAANTFEMLIFSYQTVKHNNPEDSHLFLGYMHKNSVELK
jgi:hypothetical protein